MPSSVKALFLLIVIAISSSSVISMAADLPTDKTTKTTDIHDIESDDMINQRITRILKASEWFYELDVQTNSGIVTLNGKTLETSHKDWAEKISGQTENVVAVINKLVIAKPNPWSLTPIADQAKHLVAISVKHTPTIVISLLILICTYFLAKKMADLTRIYVWHRVESQMLRNLLGKLVAAPFILLGIYLVFNLSGLDSLATTVIGGTGLLGLILGIAFRDITENFLASILLSIQRPFVLGDIIRVLDYTGMVDALTTRGTVIITLDGNHVQIPNTIIYKQPITNFTANPNIRQSFKVGIGYDVKISQVQEIILSLFNQHEAVLADPEPLVLVEDLASSSVVMCIYFWIDSNKYSLLKVRSSVIRLVKHSLMQAGISMPDDAREIIFPQGVDVNFKGENSPVPSATSSNHYNKSTEDETVDDVQCTSTAEGNLSSEDQVLKQQSKNGVLGENETNIL